MASKPRARLTTTSLTDETPQKEFLCMSSPGEVVTDPRQKAGSAVKPAEAPVGLATASAKDKRFGDEGFGSHDIKYVRAS